MKFYHSIPLSLVILVTSTLALATPAYATPTLWTSPYGMKAEDRIIDTIESYKLNEDLYPGDHAERARKWVYEETASFSTIATAPEYLQTFDRYILLVTGAFAFLYLYYIYKLNKPDFKAEQLVFKHVAVMFILIIIGSLAFLTRDGSPIPPAYDILFFTKSSYSSIWFMGVLATVVTLIAVYKIFDWSKALFSRKQMAVAIIFYTITLVPTFFPFGALIAFAHLYYRNRAQNKIGIASTK